MITEEGKYHLRQKLWMLTDWKKLLKHIKHYKEYLSNRLARTTQNLRNKNKYKTESRKYHTLSSLQASSNLSIARPQVNQRKIEPT